LLLLAFAVEIRQTEVIARGNNHSLAPTHGICAAQRVLAEAEADNTIYLDKWNRLMLDSCLMFGMAC
jgi:hypothetical protein